MQTTGSTVLLFVVSVVGGDFPLGQPRVQLESLHGKVIVAVQELFERYDLPSDPKLTLVLRSEHNFPCLNYHIDHLYQRKGAALNISITGASIGSTYLTAPGPATATIQPDLTNGLYRLYIEMDGRTDLYDLEVSDSAVRLTPRDTVISRPEVQLVWWYPPQSFAFFCSMRVQEAWLCDAFRDTLQTNLSLVLLQPPSSGQWPYPLRSEGYGYNAPARFYRCATEKDVDSALASLRSFAHAQVKDPSGAGLSIRTWKNTSRGSLFRNIPQLFFSSERRLPCCSYSVSSLLWWRSLLGEQPAVGCNST